MLSRSPTLAELLNHAKERWHESLRVALPARVERYDSAQQLVDVQPLIKDRLEDATGTAVPLQLPVINNVPLMFPGAGGFHITFPVQVGDTVLVVFADKSIDAWQDQGGMQDPDDTRRHHLSDAIAIPGLHDNKTPVQSPATNVIEIGQNGAAAEFVATDQRVLTELNKLKTHFSAVETIITGPPINEPGNGAPSVFQTALSSAIGLTPYPNPTAPASATVKIKG